MNQHPFFILGAERGDHVRVEVTGRAHPEASDFWDGNWVNTRISARAGGFRGGASAFLRTTDFADFREQLHTLHQRLTGEAVFETLEGWLAIRVVGDGRGHMDTRVTLTDEPGVGNKLLFAVPDLDQTHIFDTIAHLCEIEEMYPTIGAPAA